jgi:hypothetical protein
LKDITQHINDAADGKTHIHFSTVALAEIKPSHLIQKGYGDINDFMADFEGAFSPISPTPDILAQSGSVRDISYPHPTVGEKDRVLGTADAIHLMSCVYVRDVLGIAKIVFHTLDAGKGKNWEGACVPLLTFEKWTVGIPKNPYVPKIVALKRELPTHPQASMF